MYQLSDQAAVDIAFLGEIALGDKGNELVKRSCEAWLNHYHPIVCKGWVIPVYKKEDTK